MEIQDPEKSADTLEMLSERARNVLVQNKLASMLLMYEHYRREGSFLSLRQCGPKTNKELVRFCDEVAKKEYDSSILIREDTIFTKHGTEHDFTDLLKNAEGRFESQEKIERVDAVYMALSDRTRNTLVRNGIVGVEAFLEFYRESDDFSKLSHCGPKTSAELEYCATTILEILEDRKAG
ncbi:MAG: hypothetical protein LAT67_02405 [Balneolales bacterium]|nr:hypothetical protein [Balneolales bacterium]